MSTTQLGSGLGEIWLVMSNKNQETKTQCTKITFKNETEVFIKIRLLDKQCKVL
jgi:hypothetical protein